MACIERLMSNAPNRFHVITAGSVSYPRLTSTGVNHIMYEQNVSSEGMPRTTATIPELTDLIEGGRRSRHF